MNINRLAAIVSTVAVITAVVAGLYMSGSPGLQRQLRIDERRVEDLQRISGAINGYWEKYKQQPDNLSVLVDGQRLKSLPRDPQTGADYRFESIDALSYRLCALFSMASEQSDTQQFWHHKSGEQCYEFHLEPDKQ